MSYRQSPLRPSSRRRRGARRRLVVLIVVLLAVAAGVGYKLYPGKATHQSGVQATGSPGHQSGPTPKPSPDTQLAQAFATAWSNGDLSTVQYTAGVTGAQVQTQYSAIVQGLQARSVQVTAQPVTQTPDDNVVQSVLAVQWNLPGNQVWSYQSSVNIDAVNGQWQIAWQPSIIQPTLAPGDSMAYSRLAATRATILDGAGQPIITDRAVTDIGVEAGKVGDPTAAASELATILGVDETSLIARIKAAASDEFVDVITLRNTDYDKVSAQLTVVPGLVLRDETLALSPSHDFARAFIGTVGPVTKQIVDESNGRYVDGDVAGLSGLEQAYDPLIGGTPGFQITVNHPPSTVSTQPPTIVKVQAPVNGVNLQTTLDQNVELAADDALETITNQPSALVAVRISTGQVVAVANGPSGGGFDTALLGAVPPGSAFKIVTTTALLEQGFNVNTSVPCTPQILVDGKTFHNYEGEQLGSVPFHTDFAKSCNTAFISLAPKVGGPTLYNTAAALGIGACWSLGTPAFRGQVVPPKDDADLAATSFGQGSTLVSPVSLAVAVGTVARGHYISPQLVQNGNPQSCTARSSSSSSAPSSASPAVSAPASAVASAPAPSIGPPLPANVVAELHSLMREVVTVGTGVVLLKAPGGPVMAKTGTAEYGSGSTPSTHAWLVGYQGDIAFAVYVQDGQSGGTVAAPVALSFLQNLSQQH